MRQRLRGAGRAALARLRRHRNSGTGRHHGIEGFREFSNARGVVVRGTGDLADAFLPPYGPVAQAIVDSVFQAAAGPAAAPGID